MPETSPNSTVRVALEIEYDGHMFCGWQKQLAPQQPTIQASLERAISQVADQDVAIVCAGRTDRGVHATGQVIHFDAAINRGDKAWTAGVNSLLPAAIRVRRSRVVDDQFHARFSALSRRYLYVIYEAKIAPALLTHQLTHVQNELDVDAMYKAAQFLLGENNFSAFRAAGCQSRTPFRCVHWLNVKRNNRFVVIDIQANAFLQHMVRNIAGVLLAIGTHKQEPVWARELLLSRDRTRGAATAPASGLYLIEVNYPPQYQLSVSELGPCFLQPYS